MSTLEISSPPLSRPQPVGVLPLPAGYLLVEAPDGDQAVVDLVAGRLPGVWSDHLEHVRAALAGDTSEALVLVGDGDRPIDVVNRLVLLGTPEALETALDLGGEVGAHARLVGYALGLLDEAPAGDGLDGELLAMSLAGRAAAATEAGDDRTAAALLDEAVAAAAPVSSALTGQLLGALADARTAAGDAPGAVLGLRDRAIALLEGTDLAIGLAEQHLAKGMAIHEVAGDNRGALVGAVRSYQSAARLVDIESAPELFATIHVNLATAYLTMPMVEASDQLRVGVAIQSLRQALRVFTPDTHPARWSSTQLNLANALVYMPSGKRADNIIEAVELYEAVLEARDADEDPLAYARVAANQGNALAHLGIFDHATARLHEARFIFEGHDDLEAVTTVRSVLDEIAKQVAARGGAGKHQHAVPPVDPSAAPGAPDAASSRYPTREDSP